VGFFEKGFFCFLLLSKLMMLSFLFFDDVIPCFLFFHELKSLFDPWTLILFLENLIGYLHFGSLMVFCNCVFCCCLCTFVAGDSKNVQSSTTKI